MKKIMIAFLLLAGFSTNAQTLANPNFESWATTASYYTDTLPSNWWPFYCNTVKQTTDSYQGTYATKIQGWFACGIAPGVLVNGQAPVDYGDFIQSGTPFTTKPTSIAGYYKYNDQGTGDSAEVTIVLKRYNTTLMKRDTIAYSTKTLPATSSYALFTLNIADLMPGEDVLRFTRITESSLYNWGEFDLFRKIIIIEDLDGLKEEALYALRELISNQFLSSSVSMKDKKGNNKSTRKEVKGQFSSLSATTKGETYEDNMSRSFLIAVDESKEQTTRIIEHQNKRNAGEINPKDKEKAVAFIQQIVRNLKYYEVINPYATKLQLPEKVHKIRRLNEMYQAVIKQVTFLNQYQRKQTADGKLITTIEDIEIATEILFESIILKVDELDGSLRQFFEKVKKYLKEKNQEFTQREIRQEFNISKSQCSRFIIQLVELEYITLKYGGNLKLQKYVIDYWDNHQKLRLEIKDFLMKQIEKLK